MSSSRPPFSWEKGVFKPAPQHNTINNPHPQPPSFGAFLLGSDLARGSLGVGWGTPLLRRSTLLLRRSGLTSTRWGQTTSRSPRSSPSCCSKSFRAKSKDCKVGKYLNQGSNNKTYTNTIETHNLLWIFFGVLKVWCDVFLFFLEGGWKWMMCWSICEI